jgi:hypothetical protein
MTPAAAIAAWSEPEHWPGFFEGFRRIVELDPDWPAHGALAVWESGPDGRGRITERVVEHDPAACLVTEVTEEALEGGSPRLRGRQTFAVTADDGPAIAASEETPPAPASSQGELRLEYELVRGRGVPGPITDLLFVRRALRDSLGRTLERFAAEAVRETAR